MKKNVIKRITRTLATASQLIIAAPVRLPPKVVAVAKYVSLGTALLEALDREEESVRAKNLSPPPYLDTQTGEQEAPSYGH